MAAMSFDQYFDSIDKQSRQSQNSDDWYAIVEEALYAADIMAAQLHRQQLEASLMKPLPMIPEDDAIESPGLRSRAEIVRPKTADATCSKGKASWRLEVQQHMSEMPKDLVISRQRSSMYDMDIDFDSPLSPESDELDSWVGNVCSTGRNSMSSLRSKPYTRQSSYTDSAVSERRISVSAGSSILARSSKSTSSSMYSTDTSIDSPISSAMCSCKHSPQPSANSVAAPRKVRSEESSAKACFFEFSDGEEEEKGKEEEVTVARPQSSGSSYVKHLRQKALSIRVATSKLARFRVRTTSLPANDGPMLPGWLSRRSSVDVDRNPTSTTEYDPWECKLDNELTFGAAASAKAKRVLGM